MKKALAVILLSVVALLPLACGKNLSPTTTQTIVVVIPTSTPSLPGLDIAGPTTITTGLYNYSYVHVHPGGVLQLEGPAGGENASVVLNLSGYFAVDSGATVIGDGVGYPSCQGPGAPVSCAVSNAGGGHGGTSGTDAGNDTRGAVNDNPLSPSLMGSGGGDNGPGYGGAFFEVYAPNGAATLNGFISVNGAQGSAGGSGGGAGGALFIQADDIAGTGTCEANGAGGGGIVLFKVHNGYFFTGPVSVSGGYSGFSQGLGEAGAFNVVNF